MMERGVNSTTVRPNRNCAKVGARIQRLQNIEGDLNTGKRGIEDYEEVLKQHAKSLEQDKVDAQIHKWSGRTPIEKLLLAQGMGINRKKNQSANFKNILIACLLESMSIDDRRTEIFEHHRFGELNAQTQQVIEKTEVKIALAQLTSIKKPIKKLLYIQGSGFHFKKNILHHLISDFSAAELKRVVKHRKWESLSILMVMLSVFLMALFALTLSEIAYNRQRDENFFRLRCGAHQEEQKGILTGSQRNDATFFYQTIRLFRFYTNFRQVAMVIPFLVVLA
uniref:Uncharacterized protein n=1 Tax=Ditylenchus dipsaci TaxID=166011 RepID=A0A915DE93_9BILA